MLFSCAISLFTGVSHSAEILPVHSFGTLDDGRPVSLYTLENKSGMRAVISNYGGIVVSLHVPDRDRKVG